MAIRLLPLSPKLSVNDVVAYVQSSQRVCQRVFVADTYVQGAENWAECPWGWQTEVAGIEIINIDHHAPAKRMERPISSGNLAIEYLRANAPAPDDLVLINHCDCDSIVSSSLVSGDVPPSDDLGNVGETSRRTLRMDA